MKLLAKSALTVSMVLALSASVNAASLGQLTVTSQANQNFQATFLVHDVSPEGGSLTARLAPASTYEQYRITMPESAKGLKLALINKNPLTLRISGSRPAQERSFPLLVELNEAGKVTVRQYNIFIGASGSVEPVAVNAGPAPITTAQPVAATASKAPAAAPKATATQPAEDESGMTPLQRMQARNYDLNKPIVVEPGYTPWSLGVLYQKRYPQASVNQVLVALAIHNPEAFPEGNVRVLRAGSKLSAPPASLVDSIDRDAARRIVQQGLNIEDVAREPAPIAKAETRPAAKPARAHKEPARTEPVKEKAPEPKPEPKPEPIPQAVPPAEPVEVLPPIEATQPQTEVPGQPQEPLPSTESQPLTEQPPVTQEGAQAEENLQESMPTLEIMTEDEVLPPEEEETSWLWYLLIVVLLGAAGFIYWRTKQGKQVDFESFKSVMNRSRMNQPREEPSGPKEPVEPTMPAAAETQQQPSQTTTYSYPAQNQKVEQVPPTAEAGASNIFDLVGDELPLNGEPTAKEVPPQTKQPAPEPQPTTNMRDSLAMARSFMAIGARDEAIQLLQEVMQKGSPADRAEAQQMLSQIHGQQA